jgi:hypothetical protein
MARVAIRISSAAIEVELENASHAGNVFPNVFLCPGRDDI